MSAVMLGVAGGAFVVGLLAAAPAWIAGIKSVKGDLRLISLAWAAVFIGQGQMFEQESTVRGLTSLNIGALYQLGWMAVGVSLIALALLRVKVNVSGAKVAVAGLAAYGFAGIISSAFSPAISLSLYKSGQILMDVALVMIVLTAAMRVSRPRAILELTYFLLALVLASAALGGYLIPEQAFKSIDGAYTGVLNGVYPQVHANELGLLGAIMLVVGVRRSVEPGGGALRIYWTGVMLLAGAVLFYAQARTSLASSLFSIAVLSIFIPKLRPYAVLGILAGLFLLVSQLLGGMNLQIEGTVVETYLRRGASDEQIASLSGRLGLWQIGWEMFKGSPVFGHGMDAGVRYGGPEYGLPEGTNMHSAHLQILVNTGFLGYAGWLVFMAAVVSSILAALKRVPGGVRSEEGRLRLELLLVAFVIVFRTFLGHVMVTHHFSFMVFLALLVCAVASLKRGGKRDVSDDDLNEALRDDLSERRSNGIWKATRKHVR